MTETRHSDKDVERDNLLKQGSEMDREANRAGRQDAESSCTRMNVFSIDEIHFSALRLLPVFDVDHSLVQYDKS